LVANDLPITLPIEVFCHYDGTWSSGFVVAGWTSTGYRLRRTSDDTVLPGEFSTAEVRQASADGSSI
jgi:hypothetical protein